MSVSKRPSTSSLRRFITTRPYVTVAELRRRFCVDEPDAVCSLRRDGTTVFVGLPERETAKLQELWTRDEIGLEMSVEVRAPVVVGIYPMHIARFIQDYGSGHVAAPNGKSNGINEQQAPVGVGPVHSNGHPRPGDGRNNADLNGSATRRPSASTSDLAPLE